MIALVLSYGMTRVVVDTDVVVAATGSRGGAARGVLRRCLIRDYVPLIGVALFTEYEDVFARESLWRKTSISKLDREELLAGLASVAEWIEVYFLWRPNLRDEGDNHLIDLAVAGGAQAIVTRNVRDFNASELQFPDLKVLTPQQCLKEFPCLP